MKPLNESAKKNAIKKFIGIYGLSVAVILLSSFFLFSSPVKVLKEEAKNFSDFKSNYSTLLKKTAMINSQVNELLVVKQAINNNPAPGLDSMARQYIDNINKQVISLRNDSANAALKPFKNDMANYLSAYNAVLYYSVNDIQNREAASTISKSLPASTSNNILQLENAKLKIENKRLSEENIQLKLPKPDIANSGADLKSLQNKLSQIEKEKNDCLSQFAKASDDAKIKDGQLKDRDDQIGKLTVSLKNINPQKLGEEEKAVLIYDKVESIVEKAKAAKNGVYTGLITVLQGIRPSYPDNVKLDKKIKEIKEIKFVF